MFVIFDFEIAILVIPHKSFTIGLVYEIERNDEGLTKKLLMA